MVDKSGNQVQDTDYYTGEFPMMPYGSPFTAEERMHTGKQFRFQ